MFLYMDQGGTDTPFSFRELAPQVARAIKLGRKYLLCEKLYIVNPLVFHIFRLKL
jgi:hypothetical protein